MAIRGIGVDVVELARIEAACARHPQFASRVLTEREQAACRPVAANSARIAARFAVKEAVSKALGTGLGKVALKDIETVNDASGAPQVHLYGEAAAQAARMGVRTIFCSISHEHTVAVAMVVLEG